MFDVNDAEHVALRVVARRIVAGWRAAQTEEVTDEEARERRSQFLVISS